MLKKPYAKSSRKDRAGELLRQVIADFICYQLSIPITISRVEVTKDLLGAKIFFVLPAIDASYSISARESVLKMLPKHLLAELHKVHQDRTDQTAQLFLCYLEHVKPQIRMHIAKTASLRAVPNLFFAIEAESDYLAQNR